MVVSRVEGQIETEGYAAYADYYTQAYADDIIIILLRGKHVEVLIQLIQETPEDNTAVM